MADRDYRRNEEYIGREFERDQGPRDTRGGYGRAQDRDQSGRGSETRRNWSGGFDDQRGGRDTGRDYERADYGSGWRGEQGRGLGRPEAERAWGAEYRQGDWYQRPVPTDFDRDFPRGRGYGDVGYGRGDYGRPDWSRGSDVGYDSWSRNYWDSETDYGRGGWSGERGNWSRSGRGDERGMWDKATDEVSSWFGDEDAERRREMDRHRGRGPKNYARSEERIREDVCDRLTYDPRVDASDIEVTVSGGEVTLTGHVNSRAERRRAEDCAESVSGITHVQNNLRVQERGFGSSMPDSSGTTAFGTGETASRAGSGGESRTAGKTTTR